MKQILTIIALCFVFTLSAQIRFSALPELDSLGNSDMLLTQRGGSFMSFSLATLSDFLESSQVDTMYLSGNTLVTITTTPDTLTVDFSQYITPSELSDSLTSQRVLTALTYAMTTQLDDSTTVLRALIDSATPDSALFVTLSHLADSTAAIRADISSDGVVTSGTVTGSTLRLSRSEGLSDVYIDVSSLSGGNIQSYRSNCISYVEELTPPEKVLDTVGYLAFPSAEYVPKCNKIIIAHYHGLSHATFGRIVVRTSGDWGKTWSASNFIEADSTINWRTMSVKVLPNDTILLAYSDASQNMYIRKSGDCGQTWTSRQLIDVGNNFEGKPVVTETGRIIYALYSNSPATGVITSLYSDDYGVTWNTSTVPTVSGATLTETGIFRWQDTIVMIMRDEANVNTVWRSESTDDGITWSTPEDINFPNWIAGKPATEMLSNGLVIMSYRSNNEGGTPKHGGVVVSADLGRTWTQEVEQLPTKRWDYGTFVQVGDVVLCFHSGSATPYYKLYRSAYVTGGCDLVDDEENIRSANQSAAFIAKEYPTARHGMQRKNNVIQRGNSSLEETEANFLSPLYDDLETYFYHAHGNEVADSINEPVIRYESDGDVYFGTKGNTTPLKKSFAFLKTKAAVVIGTPAAAAYSNAGLNSLSVGNQSRAEGDEGAVIGTLMYARDNSTNYIAAGQQSNLGLISAGAFGQVINTVENKRVYCGLVYGLSVDHSNLSYGMYGGNQVDFLGDAHNNSIINGSSMDYTNQSFSFVNLAPYLYTDIATSRAATSAVNRSLLLGQIPEGETLTNVNDAVIVGRRNQVTAGDNSLILGGNISNSEDNVLLLNGGLNLTGVAESTDDYQIVNSTQGKAVLHYPAGFDLATNLSSGSISDGISIESTGDMNMRNNNITDVADPSSAQDAATKNYVDTKVPSGTEGRSARFDSSGNLEDGDWLTSGGVTRSQLTTAVGIPVGGSATRPGSPQNGDLRYNSDGASPEIYMSGDWFEFEMEGYNKSGMISGTPDVNGDLTVTHNLPLTPTSIELTAKGTTIYHVQPHSEDATTFKIRVWDSSNAIFTSGTVNVYWTARN